MLDLALAWFVEMAPKVLMASGSMLVVAIGKKLVDAFAHRVTKSWLKDVKELDAMAERSEEELAAAEAFKLETAAAKDARIAELESCVDRIARQLALTNHEREAYETVARELDQKLVDMNCGHTPILKPPMSEPPDVVEEDDRPTLPPALPPLPPLPPPWGPGKKKP